LDALGVGVLLIGLYLVVDFVLAARKTGRTLGDRLANTRVVDVRSEAARLIHAKW
jgi:uncharacterized RDD family membrane protein YckC